ncbi:MAG: precorrin-6A reductase [Clostridia bacterium]
MVKVIVFGGTSEGRILAEALSKRSIPSLVCVASQYGEQLLTCVPPVIVHTGKLDRADIAALLVREQPEMVIDATHPYAAVVSDNIAVACAAAQVRLTRVLRAAQDLDGCIVFDTLLSLTDWLNTTEGTIFSTTGAKEAAMLTTVKGYADRIWMRMLPSIESIANCIALGYPARHMICMQGPFSRILNTAMFQTVGADILITKESGTGGGFMEKVQAARDCDMRIAVLRRPRSEQGSTLHEVLQQLTMLSESNDENGDMQA